MSSPIKEIFIPQLPLAPPLYRWEANEEDDDITVSFTEDLDVRAVVGCDEPPRMPCRHAAASGGGGGGGVEQAPRIPQRKSAKFEAPRMPTRRRDNQELYTTTSPRSTRKNRLQSAPSRGLAILHELETNGNDKLPPRRPRRSSTPPKYMSHREIKAVTLKPVQSITDDDGEQVLIQVKDTQAMPLSEVTSNGTTGCAEGMKDISIVYCIRNTACGSNRNHGLGLTELSQRVEGINILGVIKDNAQHQTEFYKDYFSFPLYTDEKASLFTALGERKLSVWKMIKKTPKLLKICNDKKIKSFPEFKEDFWIQGGLMLFDSQQRLRFVYYEKFGDDLDLEALEWAIQEARQPPVSLQEETTAASASFVTTDTSTINQTQIETLVEC